MNKEVRLGREKYFLEKIRRIRIVVFKRIKKKEGGGEPRKSRGKREMSLSIWIIRTSTRGEDKDLAVKGSSRIACLGSEEFSGFTRNLGQRFNFQPGPPPFAIFCLSYSRKRFQSNCREKFRISIQNLPSKCTNMGEGWKKFRNFRAVIPLELGQAVELHLYETCHGWTNVFHVTNAVSTG